MGLEGLLSGWRWIVLHRFAWGFFDRHGVILLHWWCCQGLVRRLIAVLLSMTRQILRLLFAAHPISLTYFIRLNSDFLQFFCISIRIFFSFFILMEFSDRVFSANATEKSVMKIGADLVYFPTLRLPTLEQVGLKLSLTAMPCVLYWLNRCVKQVLWSWPGHSVGCLKLDLVWLQSIWLPVLLLQSWECNRIQYPNILIGASTRYFIARDEDVLGTPNVFYCLPLRFGSQARGPKLRVSSNWDSTCSLI